MRCALLVSDPADVAGGSGTTVAVARLRHALTDTGVSVPVLRPASRRLGGTVARWRFNRAVLDHRLLEYDAVLGVNGDGWREIF